MDEKVKDIIEKVKASAAYAGEVVGAQAQKAGKKAGDLMEITKLNIQIFDLNNEISQLFRQLGEVIYNAHTNPDADSSAVDEILAEIDKKRADITELRERINQFKHTKKCKNPECGKVCGKNDTYCSHCGAAL